MTVSHLFREQLTCRGTGRWIFESVDIKINRNGLTDAGSKAAFSDRTTTVQHSILQFLLIIYVAQILKT